jgi:hypothetical protein
MRAEIKDYSLQSKRTWLRNKYQGFYNRYDKVKSEVVWRFFITFNPVKVDLSRVQPGSMPVLINNFNRLDLLRLQISWLSSLPTPVSIIIVDNKSDYQPLLDFYKTLQGSNIQVVMLGFNSWRKGLVEVAKQLKAFDKYVITDPDLLPYPDTPSDLLSHLAQLLDDHSEYNHIGTSLEINDLPQTDLGQKVTRHESQFWPPIAERVGKFAFVGPIDTTFAMYRRSSKVELIAPSLRTDRPYRLHHSDWYLKPGEFTSEYIHYVETAGMCASWAKDVRGQEH